MKTREFGIIALIIIVLSFFIGFASADDAYMSVEEVCHSFDGAPDPHKWRVTSTGKIVCIFKNVTDPSALHSNENLVGVEIKKVVAKAQPGKYKVVLRRTVSKVEFCSGDVTSEFLPECEKPFPLPG